MEADAIKFSEEVNKTCNDLGIMSLTKRINELKKASEQEDFWQDSASAQHTMQEISKLEKRVEPWLEMQRTANDLLELSKLNDPKLEAELRNNMTIALSQFSQLKEHLSLSGPYDDHGALLSITSGAGGTDAQDWTQMLFRMYTRYFDKKDWKYRVDDDSPGEEAGLKSVVIEVDGNDFVYGKLKGEHGVHRLVRLSPFNADHLRQTSFAKVEIAPKIDSPGEVNIDDKDLKIDVYRSGGHGGQSVNTTDSAVRVTHLPSGISVAIQNERSQLQNRETALKILRSKLTQIQLEQHAQTFRDLKGPNQSAEWGSQIRNYVLHPYKQVKDLRSNYESRNVDDVLDGDLDSLIDAFIKMSSS